MWVSSAQSEHKRCSCHSQPSLASREGSARRHLSVISGLPLLPPVSQRPGRPTWHRTESRPRAPGEIDSWSLNAVRTESHPESKGKQKMLLLCGPCQRKPSPFRPGEPAWGWGHKRCSRLPFWEQVLPDGPGERASGKGGRKAQLERRLLYGEAGRPSGPGGSQAHTHQNLLGQVPVPPRRFPFSKAGRSLRIHISRKSSDNTAEGPLPRKTVSPVFSGHLSAWVL